MESFAFIVSPITIKQLKGFWSILRIKNLAPFKVLHIKRIKSIQGKEIQGYLIICPGPLDEDFILDKIFAAGHLAEKLGVRILGLGDFVAAVADKEYKRLTKSLKMPVTSGNALVAWSVFEAIYRLTRARNIALKKSTLAIIGATSSVGNLCTRKLSEYISKIIITSKDKDKLEQLKETTLHLNSIELIMEEDAYKAVQDADIVINTDNLQEKLFDIGKLKPNSIFCDVSLRYNISDKSKLRQDITFIQAGLIKLPYPDRLGIKNGLPKGITYASLAETMLLVFEEKFVDYSLGENVNLDKLEEIADIAVQHGFEVWVPEAPVL